MTRAGLESEAIKRLVQGIRDGTLEGILVRCLDGSISPSLGLMQMLIETEDATAVRAAVDDVTRRAADLSRSGDNLVRDRVDELTQLVVENEPGCSRIAEMLRSGMDSPDQATTIEDGIAFCERLFDWSVQQSEEASVALYSLGNPDILGRATREIMDQLERWEIIAPGRTVLDIGCGIGRLEIELSPRVCAVHGIDVSAQMINVAIRRCGALLNVHLRKGTGRDLSEYPDEMFDAAIAVDSFPYICQSGAALVDRYFAEAARVLKPGGDLVILNLCYGSDDTTDRKTVRKLAARHSFDVLVAGKRPFALWDGFAFHLRKRTENR